MTLQPMFNNFTADARQNCQLSQEYNNARYYWSPITADGQDSGTVMVGLRKGEKIA